MKSPTPASFLVELFKKLVMNMVKHLFFQDSLMFHQEKLSYNLPAVKEDIKSVMNISAKGSADRLGLKKGQ